MALEQKAVANAASTLVGASILGDISLALQSWPILAFIGLGTIGGVSGFFLAQESGRFDQSSRRDIWCFLGRRIILGAAIGVVVYVGWADQSEMRGLWLLATGVIATSPVEMVRKVIEVLTGLVQKRMGQ